MISIASDPDLAIKILIPVSSKYPVKINKNILIIINKKTLS